MLVDASTRNGALLVRISEIADRLTLRGDGGGAFPYQAWAAIAETGLFAEMTDMRHDAPVRVLRTMAALERLGEVCEDPGLNFSVATHLASTICAVTRFGTPEVKARYLPDLTTGSLVGAHAISEAAAGSDASRWRPRPCETATTSF